MVGYGISPGEDRWLRLGIKNRSKNTDLIIKNERCYEYEHVTRTTAIGELTTMFFYPNCMNHVFFYSFIKKP